MQQRDDHWNTRGQARTAEPLTPVPDRDAYPAPSGHGADDERRTDGAEAKLTDAGQQAQAKAAEVGHKAQEKADSALDTAAGSMSHAAETLREMSEGSGGVQEQAGVKLAEGMEKTAGYLREHDTGQLWDDLEQFVREHPTQAVTGAVAVGFILGRAMR